MCKGMRHFVLIKARYHVHIGSVGRRSLQMPEAQGGVSSVAEREALVLHCLLASSEAVIVDKIRTQDLGVGYSRRQNAETIGCLSTSNLGLQGMLRDARCSSLAKVGLPMT